MVIIFFLIVFGFIFLYSKIWEKTWQKNFVVGLDLKQAEIFQGDNFSLTEILVNNKKMSLPFVRVSVPLDWPFYLVEEDKSSRMIRDLHQIYTLDGYDQVKREFFIKVNKRGIYRISEVELYVKDLVTKMEMKKNYPVQKEIIVYPVFLEEKIFLNSFQKSLGETLTRFSLMEDPLLFRGIRQMHPGDNYRRINWKKSAGLPEFYVNQYEAVAKKRLTLVLYLPHYFDWRIEKQLEGVLSLFVTVARESLFNGYQLDIISNARNKEGQEVFPKSVSAIEVLLRGGAGVDFFNTSSESLLKGDILSQKSEKICVCAIDTKNNREIQDQLNKQNLLWFNVVEKSSEEKWDWLKEVLL